MSPDIKLIEVFMKFRSKELGQLRFRRYNLNDLISIEKHLDKISDDRRFVYRHLHNQLHSPEIKGPFNISGNVGKVTFLRNREDAVDSLVINSRGREMTCSRIDVEGFLEIIEPEQIQDCSGIYRNDEIDVNIQIEFNDNKFIAKHIMYDKLDLTPVSTEVWEGPQNFIDTIKFIRDEEGRITGFRLTGHRVINLLFEQVKDKSQRKMQMLH